MAQAGHSHSYYSACTAKRCRDIDWFEIMAFHEIASHFHCKVFAYKRPWYEGILIRCFFIKMMTERIYSYEASWGFTRWLWTLPHKPLTVITQIFRFAIINIIISALALRLMIVVPYGDCLMDSYRPFWGFHISPLHTPSVFFRCLYARTLATAAWCKGATIIIVTSNDLRLSSFSFQRFPSPVTKSFLPLYTMISEGIWSFGFTHFCHSIRRTRTPPAYSKMMIFWTF